MLRHRTPMMSARVVAWLHETARPGDLVLTACSDKASLLVRWGTLGKYSHVGVVRRDGVIIEAYDHNMSVLEDDGGVFELDFQSLAYRGRVSRIGVLRPSTINMDKFEEAADHVTRHPPPFASAGALLLACLGLTTWKDRATPLSRAVERFLPVVGDGALRMQCAEFASRLYHHAESPVHLHKPRLGPYVRAAREAEEIELIEVTPPSRKPDASHRSRRSVVGHGADLMRAVRVRAKESSKLDWMDFVVPSDLAASPSFRPVGYMSVVDGQWTEILDRV